METQTKGINDVAMAQHMSHILNEVFERFQPISEPIQHLCFDGYPFYRQILKYKKPMPLTRELNEDTEYPERLILYVDTIAWKDKELESISHIALPPGIALFVTSRKIWGTEAIHELHRLAVQERRSIVPIEMTDIKEIFDAFEDENYDFIEDIIYDKIAKLESCEDYATPISDYN